jgi:DNA-binding NarL/FixJ family response regulator
MTDDTIRILIASSDSSEILQREIIVVLTPDEKFKVVGIAKRVDETVQLGRLTKPHIFLVNDILEDGDGIQLIHVLSHSYFPASACILFSENDAPAFLRQAMLAGSRQYIKQPIDAEELRAKIQLIYRYLNPITKIC